MALILAWLRAQKSDFMGQGEQIMKIYENGTIRDMTAAEMAAAEEAAAKYAAEEKHRPLSMAEVQEIMIKQQINTFAVDDATALRMIAYYPPWESNKVYDADHGCPVGYKVVQDGDLYKLRTEHTSQDNWAPGAPGTESLWERIDEQHDGSKYDPIPYSGNMALESGKYYTQGGTLYLCNRDTGNPVYHDLSALVGQYVEVVT